MIFYWASCARRFTSGEYTPGHTPAEPIKIVTRGSRPLVAGLGLCPARERGAGNEATVGRGKRKAGPPSKLIDREVSCPKIWSFVVKTGQKNPPSLALAGCFR
jgi:hypothetical protein